MKRDILLYLSVFLVVAYLSLIFLQAADIFIEKDKENRLRTKEAGYILGWVCQNGEHLLPSHGGWLLSDMCWKVQQIYGASGERKALIAALQYVVDSFLGLFKTSWVAIVVVVGVFIFFMGIRLFPGTRVELVLPHDKIH